MQTSAEYRTAYAILYTLQAKGFTTSQDVTWSFADVKTADCCAVWMILDGQWDMSFAAVRLQETRNATATTLLNLSE